MASALLDVTEPAARDAIAGRPARLSAQPPRTWRLDSARGRMLAELAGVPAARRRLLALTDAVRSGNAPAAALIERAENAEPDIERLHELLRALAEVRHLDRRIEILRVRASRPVTAAEIVACRRERAALGEAAAAILRDLPIRRSLVQTLAGELLALDDRFERAACGLAGPADTDWIRVVERRTGLPREALHQRCVRLRDADAQMRAAEQDHFEAPKVIMTKGRALCASRTQ